MKKILLLLSLMMCVFAQPSTLTFSEDELNFILKAELSSSYARLFKLQGELSYLQKQLQASIDNFASETQADGANGDFLKKKGARPLLKDILARDPQKVESDGHFTQTDDQKRALEVMNNKVLCSRKRKEIKELTDEIAVQGKQVLETFL